MNQEIKDAVNATIARTILENLDTEHRDALLQEAIVKVIGGYEFNNTVAKVAAEKAQVVAREMMSKPEWADRVQQAIRLGMADYLVQLRVATVDMLKEQMHGKGGDTYSKKAADLLDFWPKVGK